MAENVRFSIKRYSDCLPPKDKARFYQSLANRTRSAAHRGDAELNLGCTSMSDEGLRLIAPFLRISKGDQIKLFDNCLTDLSMELLGENLPATCHVLRLNNNHITNAGVVALLSHVLDVTYLTNELFGSLIVALQYNISLVDLNFFGVGNVFFTQSAYHDWHAFRTLQIRSILKKRHIAAFVMAFHPRLGRHSPDANCPDDICLFGISIRLRNSSSQLVLFVIL